MKRPLNKHIFAAREWLGQRNRREMAFFVALIYPLALVYSKFTLTLCMIAWLAIALFEVKLPSGGGFKLSLNPAIRQRGKAFFRSPYVWTTLFFWIVLFSGFYTHDQTYWLERVRIKLAFLALPVAFFLLPSFTTREIKLIFYAFLAALFLSSIDVGITYWNNYEPITQALGRGVPIPTPVSHIRYSLMLAFGILAGLYIFVKKRRELLSKEQLFLAITVLSLFTFIHILSVRSGLLTLYLALVTAALVYAIQNRRIWATAVFLMGLAVLPLLAYQFIPGFRNRIDYARYDWQMYIQGKGANYSDSDRLVSLETGLTIAREHPFLGVGAGDLKQEVKAIYEKKYPEGMQVKMPHNQLLSVWAGTGIIGLALFLAGFFVPLYYGRNYRNLLFSLFHLTIFISFMMENTLENAVGIAFYSFFLMLFLNNPNEWGSSPKENPS